MTETLQMLIASLKTRIEEAGWSLVYRSPAVVTVSTVLDALDELSAALSPTESLVEQTASMQVERYPLSSEFQVEIQRNLNIGRGYDESDLCPTCGVVAPRPAHGGA